MMGLRRAFAALCRRIQQLFCSHHWDRSMDPDAVPWSCCWCDATSEATPPPDGRLECRRPQAWLAPPRRYDDDALRTLADNWRQQVEPPSTGAYAGGGMAGRR
jgi:hypothetical protein